MDFFENKHVFTKIGIAQKLGEIKINETIDFEKLNIFKYKEFVFQQSGERNASFSLPSRIFEIMDNGNYVVGGYVTSTQKSHLFIYDPIKKTKNREVIFDKRIDELFTFKNRIVFSLRRTEHYGYKYELKIMDENLNLIREKEIRSQLIFVDESHLYCIGGGFYGFRFNLFDWYLNDINTEFEFNGDPKQNFYLKKARHGSHKINQFVKRDNKYILNYKSGDYQPDELLIFNELGVLIKKSVINGEFVIDSNNNIIINDKINNLIEYYDLNGTSTKTVSYTRPKNEKILMKQIKIDSADNIYFCQ